MSGSTIGQHCLEALQTWENNTVCILGLTECRFQENILTEACLAICSSVALIHFNNDLIRTTHESINTVTKMLQSLSVPPNPEPKTYWAQCDVCNLWRVTQLPSVWDYQTFRCDMLDITCRYGAYRGPSEGGFRSA